MNKAIIYFSDSQTIEIKEDDFIIPIVYVKTQDEIFASMGESTQVWNHTHNGLIPAILDTFSKCDFFYLNHDYNIAYSSKAIVKIELI